LVILTYTFGGDSVEAMGCAGNDLNFKVALLSDNSPTAAFTPYGAVRVVLVVRVVRVDISVITNPDMPLLLEVLDPFNSGSFNDFTVCRLLIEIVSYFTGRDGSGGSDARFS